MPGVSRSKHSTSFNGRISRYGSLTTCAPYNHAFLCLLPSAVIVSHSSPKDPFHHLPTTSVLVYSFFFFPPVYSQKYLLNSTSTVHPYSMSSPLQSSLFNICYNIQIFVVTAIPKKFLCLHIPFRTTGPHILPQA